MTLNFFKSKLRTLFTKAEEDVFHEKSPKLLATPHQSRSSLARFALPSADYSSSSSSGSSSSSSSFWISPKTPSRWSPRRYIPAKVRSSITKRQFLVLVVLLLALVVWVVPPPSVWRNRVVHITLPARVTSPYQALHSQPSEIARKSPRDALQWLQKNSQNKFAVMSRSGLFHFLPSLQVSTRPRAALISLVRNSELPGLMQSMRQLEYHWNRKYQYPWIFFNEEPFTDEFKARHCSSHNETAG